MLSSMSPTNLMSMLISDGKDTVRLLGLYLQNRQPPCITLGTFFQINTIVSKPHGLQYSPFIVLGLAYLPITSLHIVLLKSVFTDRTVEVVEWKEGRDGGLNTLLWFLQSVLLFVDFCGERGDCCSLREGSSRQRGCEWHWLALAINTALSLV